MVTTDPDIITPYSTVMPLVVEEVTWVPEEDRERLASYDQYEKMYWSELRAFKLSMRGTNDQPVYIPNPRTVVNETAHYLLKGLQIQPEDGDLNSDLGKTLKAFFKREKFFSKFHTAKWSGVVRGDWILHLTADPTKPVGSRISINSVDPASYFPEHDDDDLDRVIAVRLVEQFTGAADGKPYVRELRYAYVDVNGVRRVARAQRVLELEGWWKGEAAKVKQVELKEELLPEDITTIPVYHFKNIDWQGQPFGSSELRGFEFLLSSINQSASDEELALALMGLGVYATDAPTPTNDNGDEVAWELAPANVLEVPTGSAFNKIKGVDTVAPMIDHITMLTDALFEGSATFRTGQVDVAVAQSGVALAMKFLPTLAKLEQRDWDGQAVLEQLFFDWKFWLKAFEEGSDFTDKEIAVTLGEKLPTNRTDKLNELNNMLDRMVIDREFYRSEMTKLGYVFPDGMRERVRKEQEELAKARMFESPVNGADPSTPGGNPANNNSGGNRGANNTGRPNESGATEATPAKAN